MRGRKVVQPNKLTIPRGLYGSKIGVESSSRKHTSGCDIDIGCDNHEDHKEPAQDTSRRKNSPSSSCRSMPQCHHDNNLSNHKPGIRDSGPGPRRTALVVQAAQAHNIDNQPYLVGRRLACCRYMESCPANSPASFDRFKSKVTWELL